MNVEVIENTSDTTSKTPRFIPLAWEGDMLVPMLELAEVVPVEARTEFTVLHTNDFHSSLSGRINSATGKLTGGITRIATTISKAKAAGPTLVLDAGDSVFGSGTWWDAQGATATARLRGAAGYDLAAIGNHDLEHGLEGLVELFEGGYPFVAANLVFEESHLSEKVRPAYIVEVAGWRIGLTGVTTPSTLELVPSRMLDGMQLTDPVEALTATLNALEPMVDTIILISHLGFMGHGFGDRELTSRLAGSKVSLILGGHTHEAHNPAPVINGIVVCNAGAFGENVGKVKISPAGKGAEVKASLILQDETIEEDLEVIMLRDKLAEAFQPLHETRLLLPTITGLGEDGLSVGYHEHKFNRDREFVLLAQALQESGQVAPISLLAVPILYVLGQLPSQTAEITLAELSTAYPNIERLVELEVTGHDLKELLALQPTLQFYQQALPLWLADESRVKASQLDENALYKIITSELVAEGGLGWSLLPGVIQSSRALPFSCAEVVQQYLQSLVASSVA